MHPSHYGRMCPIETPEGPNIGLIGYLSSFARINRFGFIETPYRKVDRRVASPTRSSTSRPTTKTRRSSRRRTRRSTSRAASTRSACSCGSAAARSPTSPPNEIDYMDVSPKQIVSVATALIPFLEHDDANRALMGANMQRQAVPLLRATAPFIGTGIEARAARDAGDVVLAEDAGTVVDVAGDTVTVDYKNARQEVAPAAQVPPLEPGHLHQPEAGRLRRRHREEGRRARRRPVDAPGRARARARTCSSRSCRGRATTSRTRSCSRSGS